MRRLAILALVLVLPMVAEAQAIGTVVGKECSISWTAPTLDGSGNPLTGALLPKQANVYITTPSTSPAQGTGQAATLLPVGGIIPTSWGCAGVIPGQHWAWVSYSNVNGEGVLGNVPFVLSTAIPAAPSGLSVK